MYGGKVPMDLDWTAGVMCDDDLDSKLILNWILIKEDIFTMFVH